MKFYAYVPKDKNLIIICEFLKRSNEFYVFDLQQFLSIFNEVLTIFYII